MANQQNAPDPNTGSPDDPKLEDLIDLWLGRSAIRFNPRFPPAMERVYVAETTAARMRVMWLSSLIGCITAVVLAPLVWRLMADAHALVGLVWLGIGLPFRWCLTC